MVTAADWDEDEIGSLFSFHRTVALSRAQLSDAAEIGYIHYGDIHSKWGTHLDLSLQALPRVGVGLAASAALVAEGDLVLADASEDLDGVGRAVEICGVGDQRVVAGLHTVLLRPRAGVFASRFVGYLPATPEFRSQARTLAAGLKVYGLSKSSLRQIVVRVPPLKEQEAIAEALSDADAAIEALDEVIAKKRDVKQAAMQQLLAGRTRLSGFSGVWEEVRLGDLGRCLRGVSYDPRNDLSVGDSLTTVRLLRSNNVQQSLLGFDDVQFVSEARVSDEQMLRPGDIVVCMANGSRALVGKSGVFRRAEAQRYTFGAFMGCFRTDRSKAAPLFVRYLFLTKAYQDYINNLLAGSAINNLALSSIESLAFTVPSLEEQDAIAEVLSDMDAEVEALVAERDKMRLVKQGMMQELLSGRVRLV